MNKQIHHIALAALVCACTATSALASKPMSFNAAMNQMGQNLATHCKGNKDGAGASKGWYFVVVDGASPTTIEGKHFIELSVNGGAISDFIGPLAQPATAQQAKSLVGRKACIEYVD